jgi:hypothetical protein
MPITRRKEIEMKRLTQRSQEQGEKQPWTAPTLTVMGHVTEVVGTPKGSGGGGGEEETGGEEES